MSIENIVILHQELISAGLTISGCDSYGNVQLLEPDTNNLVPLVLAAHEQSLTSTEALTLQAAITNEQWLAYQDVRKQPIRQQREARYRTECDSLYLTITENALKAQTTPDYSTWLSLKQEIRESLPYEDEE